MPARAVLRKGGGRKEAAFLGEVLERAAGKEVPPDVAAHYAVDARQHDEVSVRADEVEGIELDAPQARQRRPYPARTSPHRAIESMVSHQRAARLVTSECEHAEWDGNG